MRYLKAFNESSKFLTTEDEIRNYLVSLDPFLSGSVVTIHSDGVVDVSQTVRISDENMKSLEVRFGRVSGNFKLSVGYSVSGSLTTLEGSPSFVEGDFMVQGQSKLTSLVGAPIEVGGGFYCSGTAITNLVGSPRIIGDVFSVGSCESLTSLEGMPDEVGELVVYGCLNLWDPSGLRDCTIGEESWNKREFQGTPIHWLHFLFGSLKNLQESLDYNYIKPPRRFTRDQIPKKMFRNYSMRFPFNDPNASTLIPCIDLFRFKEALGEFGLTVQLLSLYFGADPKYAFIDESGNWVDFDGRI